MRTRIRILMMLLTVCVGACDNPTSSSIREGPLFVDVIFELAAPVGDVRYPFQWEFGHRVVNVTDVYATRGAVSAAELILDHGEWYYRCHTVGLAEFYVDVEEEPAPVLEAQRLIIHCSPVHTVVGYYDQWVNIRPFVREMWFHPSLREDALDLELRFADDEHQIKCTGIGTYKYLWVSVLPEEFPRFFKVECLPDVPPPLPLPHPARVGQPANVSAAFLELGRVVRAFEVWPPDLAMFTGFTGNEAGDMGLVCKRTGTGVIRVFFSGGVPAWADYLIICEAHDQGGGG